MLNQALNIVFASCIDSLYYSAKNRNKIRCNMLRSNALFRITIANIFCDYPHYEFSLNSFILVCL